jgi:hypothetical protein
MWVMREFRKFAVDSISHNPEMKLEYLALDTSVERLVRRTPKPSQKRKVDVKGKGKETSKDTESGTVKGITSLAELIMEPGGGWTADFLHGSSSVADGTNGMFEVASSDDESEYYGLGGGGLSGKGLRIETVEGIKFCDVPGVRIFEKDVLWGRL